MTSTSRHITKAKCHFFKNDDFSQVLSELPEQGSVAKTKSERPAIALHLGQRACGLPGPLAAPQSPSISRRAQCRRLWAGRPCRRAGAGAAAARAPASLLLPAPCSRHHRGPGMPDGGEAGGAAGGGGDLRPH